MFRKNPRNPFLTVYHPQSKFDKLLLMLCFPMFSRVSILSSKHTFFANGLLVLHDMPIAHGE